MPITQTPLRYPGGKSSIYDLASRIIYSNGFGGQSYAEPYAGGCGLALKLLFNNAVKQIYINDIDYSIWSFWHCILNDSDRFIKRIMNVNVTLEEWQRQCEVHKNQSEHNCFDIGFATFFLNRTNRSGVIKKAGVIGGMNQSGKYKIDCRFNKEGLIKKIKRIQKYVHRINLSNKDALEFIDQIESNNDDCFLCIDPPYFDKGATLYTNFYEYNDHAKVALKLSELTSPWMLTYDNVTEIKALYSDFQKYNFNLNYSAAIKRTGTELLILSDGLTIPIESKLSKVV